MVPHKARPSPRARRAVLAGGIALAAVAASVGVVLSASASVPPTPSGWTQIFAEDFNGAANSLPNSSTWRFSTGHNYPGGPPNWGTGEIQNYTASPSNVSLDGNGNLRITPLRDGAGNWTSARIETNRQNFKAPAGGVLRIEGRIQMPNVTGDAGARVLAGVLGARRSVPGHLQLARGRRVRHHGERQRHQRRVGRAALRGGAGRSVQ